MRQAMEYQYVTYGRQGRADGTPHGAGWYPNMDAYYLIMAALAGELFDEPRYREQAERYVEFLALRQYPEGAFPYMDLQNESPGIYHDIVVSKLARYWQLTGSQKALDLAASAEIQHPFGMIRERRPVDKVVDDDVGVN